MHHQWNDVSYGEKSSSYWQELILWWWKCLYYSTGRGKLCSLYWQEFILGPKKRICVFTVTCQKNLGSVGIILFFFSFLPSAKLEIVVSRIRFRYFIFEISDKPSFVEAVLWCVTQFFYLLCSQFWQKASGWINKTFLLIKQQKWLSEFCVKIDRVE